MGMTTNMPAVMPVIAPPDLPDEARRIVDACIDLAASRDPDEGMDPAEFAEAIAAGGIDLVHVWREGDIEQDDRDRRPFIIESLSQAEWAMRLYRAAALEEAEYDAAAREWHAQIDGWLREATTRARVTQAMMGRFLEDYAIRQRVEREASNAGKLPRGGAATKVLSGEVRTTRTQPKAVMADVDVVVAWLKANGHADLVHVKETALVSEVRDVVHVVVNTDDDGNVRSTEVVDDEGRHVPGMSVDLGGVTAEVKAT